MYVHRITMFGTNLVASYAGIGTLSSYTDIYHSCEHILLLPVSKVIAEEISYKLSQISVYIQPRRYQEGNGK